MPKQKPVSLAIPSPCNESWQAMLPNDQGRYCLHCQKTVIDFTQKCDAEVARIIQASDGQVCGRMLRSQLGRPLYMARPKAGGWRLAAGFVLFALTMPHALLAQQPNSEDRSTSAWTSANTSQPSEAALANAVKSKQAIVQGNVIEAESGLPIEGATIMIQELLIGTLTSEDGSFQLEYDLNSLPDSLHLHIRYEGEEKIIPFTKQDLPVALNVALSTSQLSIYSLGGISVNQKNAPIKRRVRKGR